MAEVIQSIIAEQIEERGPRAARLARRAVRQHLARRNRQADRYMQVFVGRNGTAKTEDEFERRLYILRKSISQAIYQRRERGSPAITRSRCRAAP